MGVARASTGFTSSDTLGSGDEGKTLENGKVYVASSATISRLGTTSSALYVADGATAVVYIPKGVTLNVYGGNANGTTSAGAGIKVPATSTLIVTGGGELVATGGNASGGTDGTGGGNGVIIDDNDDPMDEWGHAGAGGNGGNGGGGAGAGIGGAGGNGGNGGAGAGWTWYDTDDNFDHDGVKGNDGGKGGDSGAGTVYLLGSISATATGGSESSTKGSSGSTGSIRVEHWGMGLSYRTCGGGGGGGGGSGSGAYGFGAGGVGGGGGGGGGCGATYQVAQGQDDDNCHGGSGGGGGGAVSGSGSQSGGANHWGVTGGSGGYGGSKGSVTSAGSVFKDSGVSVSGTYPSLSSAASHSAIEYTLRFSDGQRVDESKAVKLGYAYPSAPMPPTRPGWKFNGWFTEKDGEGTQYYNDDCTLALSLDEYAVVGDLTLYASWTLTDPDLAASIRINGVGLVGGVTQTGDGWHYDGTTGYVQLLTEGKQYVVTGDDPAGEFSLYTFNTCTVVMSNLTINASANASRPPLETKEGTASTLLFEGENALYGPSDYPAIFIRPNSTLTIGECSGKVTATGGTDAPGIGGAPGQTSGTLNIEGGTITAYGGVNGAGIGSGRSGGIKKVSISGGTVTATGGYSGAGIGSGRGGTFTELNISGGTVTATGSEIPEWGNPASGIGGGYDSTGDGVIKISGGRVNAVGGGTFGAGIGSGVAGSFRTSNLSIEISGGYITATSVASSCIGPGYRISCGPIKITGGTIFAVDPYAEALAIGKSWSGEATSVTITGGAIYVNNGDISPAPKDSYDINVFPVDLDIGRPNSKVTMFELGTRKSGFENIYTNDQGILRIWLAVSSPYSYGISLEMEDGSQHYFSFSIDNAGKVTVRDYILINGMIVPGGNDQSGTGWTYKGDTSVMTLTDDTTLGGVSTNGDFRIVVADDKVKNLTLNDLQLVAREEKYASAIAVSNAACTVTLTGENALTAQGDYAAGLEVASNSVLTVNGSGSLTATGGKHGAGIGSRGGFPKPGKMVFEGGQVTATGGDYAAGIGGGRNSNLTAENIIISGGVIYGYGGIKAAGIGSGNVGSVSQDKEIPAGAVKISGGTVVATRGAESLGDIGDLIMSGNSNDTKDYDGSLVITGGSVVGQTGRVMPCPVDGEGRPLAGVVASNLTAKAEAPVTGLPASYGVSDIFADEDGTVCLWLTPNRLAYPDEAYNFTVGGRNFKARFTDTQVGFCSGTWVGADELAVVSLMMLSSGAKLVVEADDTDWLKENAKSLKVLASSSPTMEDAEELTPEVEDNGDGTVTLTFATEGSGAKFFKVKE